MVGCTLYHSCIVCLLLYFLTYFSFSSLGSWNVWLCGLTGFSFFFFSCLGAYMQNLGLRIHIRQFFIVTIILSFHRG